MPEYLDDFKQVLKFELTYGPGHQESFQSGTKTETGSKMASIDNLPKAMPLVEKMKSILPISARPTKDLVNALRIYQEKRERKLAKDYGIAGFSVTPRKRH
jgi:hypothetical protein